MWCARQCSNLGCLSLRGVYICGTGGHTCTNRCPMCSVCVCWCGGVAGFTPAMCDGWPGAAGGLLAGWRLAATTTTMCMLPHLPVSHHRVESPYHSTHNTPTHNTPHSRLHNTHYTAH